jgi:hypothetical protein
VQLALLVQQDLPVQHQQSLVQQVLQEVLVQQALKVFKV